MRKIVAATLAVAMLASSVVAIAPANAQNTGAAVAAGVLGGIAAGAIIASQPRPYYAPAPVYVEPACRVRRERYWDGYAGVWRTRTVEVC
jgi:hypothetical protein